MRTAGFAEGTPIGGMGTGSVELGRDGYFRNISINNNRTDEERISVSNASFLAVRVLGRQQTYARILRQDSTPNNQENPAPPGLSESCFSWRGLYPASDYRLLDPQCPVRMAWCMFAPMIPFDHEAAILPALLMSVKVHNPSEEPLDISILFNWENLVGHTAQRIPKSVAPINTTFLNELEDNPIRLNPDPREDTADAPRAESSRPLPSFDTLLFGPPDEIVANADGQYCLAVKPDNHLDLSTAKWDHEDPEQALRFWSAFLERGRLTGFRSTYGEARSGAVCAEWILHPEEERTVHFVLSWHCPQFIIQGIDVGNGYANRFKTALLTARHALRHLDYYHQSIRAWHARLMSSSWPEWLGGALLDSLKVLAANSLYTKNGAFRYAAATPTDSLLWSLAAILFFPRFAHAELRLRAVQNERQIPILLCRASALSAPETGRPIELNWALASEFVMAVCTEYLLTGNRAHWNTLLPVVRWVLNALLLDDHNKDGIPDLPDQFNGRHTGMWLAALKAYAGIARAQGLTEDAMRCEETFKRAAAAYEQHFWQETPGCYRTMPAPHSAPPSPEECLQGLAGHAYAELMGTGPLSPPNRIRRSIEYLERLLPPNAEGPAVPALSGYHLAWLGSLLLRYGKADAALAMAEAWWWRHITAPRSVEGQEATGLHTDLLAVWHLLMALQGFRYEAPLMRLVVTPHLPAQLQSINAPLFTPLCLGWMKFQENNGEAYHQNIHIVFDSPLTIKRLVVRIPAELNEKDITARCHVSEIDQAFSLSKKPETDPPLWVAEFKNPVIAAGDFVFWIRKTS